MPVLLFSEAPGREPEVAHWEAAQDEVEMRGVSCSIWGFSFALPAE